eukprot:362766-Chlamydomonas_euryale.AAC.2
MARPGYRSSAGSQVGAAAVSAAAVGAAAVVSRLCAEPACMPAAGRQVKRAAAAPPPPSPTHLPCRSLGTAATPLSPPSSRLVPKRCQHGHSPRPHAVAAGTATAAVPWHVTATARDRDRDVPRHVTWPTRAPCTWPTRMFIATCTLAPWHPRHTPPHPHLCHVDQPRASEEVWVERVRCLGVVGKSVRAAAAAGGRTAKACQRDVLEARSSVDQRVAGGRVPRKRGWPAGEAERKDRLHHAHRGTKRRRAVVAGGGGAQRAAGIADVLRGRTASCSAARLEARHAACAQRAQRGVADAGNDAAGDAHLHDIERG